MIISPDAIKENTFYKICSKIDEIYYEQFPNNGSKQVGRPKKYTDLQIIKCQLYKVQNKIYCLRELEYKLKDDLIAKAIIGLEKVPDHSTFCLRFRKINQILFPKLYFLLVKRLNPDTRITFIDSTSLRSSRFDSEAKSGKSTRLGWFKGYKFHTVSSNDYIPLSFKITTANVYDNTYEHCSKLIKKLNKYNIFMLVRDAAYDSTKLFDLADKLGFKLFTDFNLKNASSIYSFKDECRRKNVIYFNSKLGKDMYKNRIKIERLFSILKERYHLESPRLYGFSRYKDHIMWTLMLYLIEKLIDRNNGVSDNKFPWNR